MKVENHSGYPREGGAPVDPERGAADGLTQDERRAVKQAVREQETAGCHVVTDGQTRWADGAFHPAGGFDGIAFDAARRPRARARLAWKGAFTVADFICAADRAKGEVKTVLTGPVTLARGTAVETDAYRDPQELAADYATGLLAETQALFEAGARSLQIDDPAVLSRPEDIPVLKEFLARLSKAKPADAVVTLATWGGDAAPVYLKLLELPVGGLVWDLPAAPALEERIAQGFSKTLGLGIVDASNAEPEKPEDLARRVERIAAKARGEVRLLPSQGLGRLTREQARKKLEALAKTWTYLEG